VKIGEILVVECVIFSSYVLNFDQNLLKC